MLSYVNEEKERHILVALAKETIMEKKISVSASFERQQRVCQRQAEDLPRIENRS